MAVATPEQMGFARAFFRRKPSVAIAALVEALEQDAWDGLIAPLAESERRRLVREALTVMKGAGVPDNATLAEIATAVGWEPPV